MSKQDNVEHILIVGSGSPQNIGRAVASTRARFSKARLILLAPRSAPSVPAYGDLDAIIEWRGLPISLGDERRAYDLKVVLFTGEGQNVLKVVAFVLPARRMLVFTEGGGTFGWSVDERLAIWNHFRWRLGSGLPLAELARRLWRALTNPLLALLAFVWLLLWHAALYVRRLRGRPR